MSPGLRQDAHRVMVGFVLGGRDVAEGAEEAAVVVPVDPLQRGKLQVLEAAPRSLLAHQLRLVEPVHRLGQRVVVGVRRGSPPR